MLTQEQIKNLKPGDKLALSYPLIFHEYDSEHDELLAKNNGEYIYFHAVDVELPSEHKTVVDARDIFRNMSEREKASINNFLSSYFRETKQQEEMRNALKKMVVDLTNIRPKHDPTRLFKKGDKVRVVKLNGRTCNLLDLDKEYILASDEDSFGLVAVRKEPGIPINLSFYWFELVTPVEELEPYFVIKGDLINGWNVCKQMNENICLSVATFTEGHPNAKAAAEAERDRLNAEYRKEQSND